MDEYDVIKIVLIVMVVLLVAAVVFAVVNADEREVSKQDGEVAFDVVMWNINPSNPASPVAIALRT